jgi:hypothetical protein
MLLVTTERGLWRFDNVFLFTNQLEVDFGIALISRVTVSILGVLVFYTVLVE